MNTYHVARRWVSIEPALPEIEPWIAVAPSGKAAWRHGFRFEDDQPETHTGETVFRGEGQLGQHRRHIDCRWSRRGYALQVEGVGRFFVSADGQRITSHHEDPRSASDLVEVILGPALTLALALQGVWCLHASAVENNGEVVAFLGESGTGKSTLARELPSMDSTLLCGADDVLPIGLEDGACPVALPRFPQLKYRLNQQPGNALPCHLPLRQIHVLDLSSRGDEPATQPLDGYAAVLALVRHTVAARLFTQDLLRRHLEFCAQVAAKIDVHLLRYPHRRDVFPRLKDMLFPGSRTC